MLPLNGYLTYHPREIARIHIAMAHVLQQNATSSHRFPSSGDELLERILHNITLEEYREDYLLQRPLLRRGSAMHLTRLASDVLLENLLQSPTCDIVVAKAGHIRPHDRPYSVDEADQLFKLGCTCVFRHAEQWCLDLAGYSTLMAQAIPGIPNVHVYQTPAGTYGLDWRCDPDEIFLVQAAGRMRYSLRANTVHPSPTACTMPPAGAWELESSPVLTFDLEPGDWLYIPSGWWHIGHAITASKTLSLGIRIFAKIDLLRSIVNDLARSAAWRCRMPGVHRPSPDTIRTCQSLLQQFSEAIGLSAYDHQAVAKLLHGRLRSGMTLRAQTASPPELSSAFGKRS